MKKSLASLRFLAMFLGIILVFGLGGSLILAAFDKEETASSAPLLDFGTIFHGVVHFIQTLFFVGFAGTNHFAQPYWTFFLQGLATTIEFCFISMPLALVSGFILAQMSQSKLRIIRQPARAFVEFIRNTPLLVQIFIVYFGIASIGLKLDANVSAIIALVINMGAYTTEIMRAGIEATSKTQIEAADCLGLSRLQTITHIILIPAMERVFPALTSQFVLLMLASSITSQISAEELTAAANAIQSETFRSFEVYVIVAVVYLALSLIYRVGFWAIGTALFVRRRKLGTAL